MTRHGDENGKSEPSSDLKRAVAGRRQVLQAAGATVGIGGIIPEKVSAQEQDAPQLEHAYINITESGDLQCLLITQEELAENDRQQVIEGLSAENPNSGEEIQAEPEDLDFGFFYERYTFENRDISPEEFAQKVNDSIDDDTSRLGSEELETLKQLNNPQQSLGIPRPPGRFVEAVIPNVADVPSSEKRFSGQPTVCPKITYDGGFPTSPPLSKVVTIQFHDGFFYESPVAESKLSYPFDARYDIDGTVGVKPSVRIPDSNSIQTIEFNVPSVGIAGSFDPTEIAPQFFHRAHPALAGLRSLAARQAILFTLLGQEVNDDLVSPSEALQRVGGQSIDAATSVTGIFAPTPPTSADVGSVAQSLLFSAGPLIIAGAGAAAGSTVVAPLAAAAVSAIGTAIAFKSAVESLLDFGETVEQVSEGILNGNLQGLAKDTKCPQNPRRENNFACSVDFASPPNLSTPIAVGQVGLFEQYFGPKSLIRANSIGELTSAAESYRDLTSEYMQQARLIDDYVAQIGPIDSDLSNTFMNVLEQLHDGDVTIADRQNELIAAVQQSFESPVAAFSTPEEITAGDTATFVGSQSVGPYGSEVDYEWQVTKTADSVIIADGQASTLDVTFDEPGTYEVSLRVSTFTTEAVDTRKKTVTVDPQPESEYRLRVNTTQLGDTVGSTSVIDSAAPAGGHIGFSTIGEGGQKDNGVIDNLRLPGETTERIESWEQSEPLSAYNRTEEDGGRFEQYFGRTTDGEASLRVFSGSAPDTIVSTEERLNLEGGEQIQVDLLHGSDNAEFFPHKTSVLIGADSEGAGGIKLELINDIENLGGARIITPDGEESRVEFTPNLNTFYTFTVGIPEEVSSLPPNLRRFDTNGEPGIQVDEVLNAIRAFNADSTIGGEPVEVNDVISVIAEFNS